MAISAGRWAALFVIFFASACAAPKLAGGRYPDPPELTFPSPDVLTEIASTPEPVPRPGSATAMADDFRISATIPPDWKDQAPEDDPPTRILQSGLRSSTTHRPTRAGQCVAQVMADFALEHGAAPGSDLADYIVGRCRAPWLRVATSWLTYEGPRIEARSVLLQRSRPQLEAMIRKASQAQEGLVDFGLAVAHTPSRFIIMLAFGPRKLVVDSVVRSADGGTFTVRGTMLEAAGSLAALMNQGPFRVEQCVMSTEVTLPKFIAVCPAAVEDDEAWIELAAFPPDKYLGSSVATLLVSPSSIFPSRYRAPRLKKAPAPVTSEPGLRAHLLDAVADLRARAGLKPLALEVAQSTVAASLAPYYFSDGNDASDAREIISLGVRAGWNVDGLVRYGLFASGAVEETGDPSLLSASLLTRPYGRLVLMDPEVDRIAIGGLWRPDAKIAGALVSTYATFDRADLADLTKRAQDVLDRRRREAGVAPIEPWNRNDAARAEAVRALTSNEVTGRDAMEWLMARHQSNYGVQAYVLEASRLEDLPWPKDLLRVGSVTADMLAAYRRPRGHAWGVYVVIILIRGRITTAGAVPQSAPVDVAVPG